MLICIYLSLNTSIIQFTAAKDDFQFSTYYGGSFDDSYEDPYDLGKMSLEIDKDDNIIIVGRTRSLDFPVTYTIPGLNRGDTDVFVSKFSPDGNTLLFSTILSGSDEDWATDVTTDLMGNIYIVGTTGSSNFFQNNSEQPTNNGGSRYYDIFVAKISSQGVIEWCRYFGGNQDDWGYSIGVDSNQNVYITGSSYSNLPALKSGHSNQGAVDCYLAKFNSTGYVQYSTMLGSTSNDWGGDLEIDGNDDIVIVGGTQSIVFPTHNAFSTTNQFGMDGVILKYNTTGDIQFATLFGGPGNVWMKGLALDQSNNLYFTGRSTKGVFTNTGWVTNDKSSDSDDVFAAKMTSNGQNLTYLTVFGGAEDDYGLNIDVDIEGKVGVTGETWSSDFPVMKPLIEYSDERDSFLTILDPDGKFISSSTFGGSEDDVCQDVKFDSSNNVVMGGFTESPDFPINNPHQNNSTLNGGSDVFIMKLKSSFLNQFPTWWVIGGSIGVVVIVGMIMLLPIKRKR